MEDGCFFPNLPIGGLEQFVTSSLASFSLILASQLVTLFAVFTTEYVKFRQNRTEDASKKCSHERETRREFRERPLVHEVDRGAQQLLPKTRP